MAVYANDIVNVKAYMNGYFQNPEEKNPGILAII
jgi:hypothetical protein